ncbi:MAG: hypothetical protein V4707_09930 [Pseudomonadota bacterium]
MRATTLIAPILAASLLGACASLPRLPGFGGGDASEPVAAPDYTPVAGELPSLRGRLYADCIAQAAGNRAYLSARDEDSTLLLFTCTGAAARTFYDGLAEHSAVIGSEFTSEGRTFRSTDKVQRNLYGVDYCSTDGRGDYACVITLNTGAFLRD